MAVMTVMAISIAVAAIITAVTLSLGQEGGINIVQYAAEQSCLTTLKGGNGLTQSRRGSRILANNQQATVGMLHHTFGIRHHRHGRQVQNNKIIVLSGPVQQLLHLYGTQAVTGIPVHLLFQKQIQTGLLVVNHGILCRNFAAEHIPDTGTYALLLQQNVAGRLAQVAVDQQNLGIFLGHGQRQISCHGRFAFILQQTGYQQHLTAVHMLLHTTAKLTDSLHIVEAGNGVGNQNTGLAMTQTGEQGFVLILMGNFTQVTAVQLLMDLIAASNRIAGEGEPGTNRCHHQGRHREHPLHLIHGIGAVAGAHGNSGWLKHLQNDFIHNLIGHNMMIIQNGIDHQKRGPGIRILYNQVDQIGIVQDGCGNRAVKPLQTRLFHNDLAHQ